MKHYYSLLNKSSLVIFFVIPSLYMPMLYQSPLLYNIMKFWSIVAFLLTGLIFLSAVVNRKIHISIALKIWLFIICLLCIIDKVNRVNNSYINFNFIIQLLSLCFIIDIGMQLYPNKIKKALYCSLSLITILNFLTQIVFPNGAFKLESVSTQFYNGSYFETRTWYSNFWFLGDKNAYGFVYVSLICLALVTYLQSRNQKEKIWAVFIVGITTLSILLSKSSTSIIGVGLMIGYILLIRYKNGRLLNLRNYLLFNVIFIVLFVLTGDTENIIFKVFTEALNKDITFTGRTTIWAKSLLLIMQQPIFGYGPLSVANHILLFNMPSVGHCHNVYLEILLQGGFLYLILFIVFIMLIVMKYKIFRNSKVISIASFTIFVHLFMMQFEASQLFRPFFYGWFIFMYHFTMLIDVEKKIFSKA